MCKRNYCTLYVYFYFVAVYTSTFRKMVIFVQFIISRYTMNNWCPLGMLGAQAFIEAEMVSIYTNSASKL